MKYFVVSDIHSHYTALYEALEKEGFERNNENHLLVISGDIMDRGPESQELKDYLDGTINKVLIFGNHEWLLLQAINRGYFGKHDLTNGTIDAAIQLSGGYKLYGIPNGDAKSFFKVRKTEGFIGSRLSSVWTQQEIIKNLIKTDIVEWIVENFYESIPGIQKRVIWNEDRTHFEIKGKPRYYLLVEDRLMLHGFFPSPDFIKTYVGSQVMTANLPDDYDILEESTKSMWEEQDCGIWSYTPYWLKQWYKCRLTKLYDYLIKKGVKHIYMGHWHKHLLVNEVYTLSLTPEYNKYSQILPSLHFTDGDTNKTKEVIVETFEVE